MIEPPVARRMPKRWTKQKYIAGVERGWFAKTRIYLYRGELCEAARMGGLHVQGLLRLQRWLMDTIWPSLDVHHRMPFDLVDDSVVDPDAVVLTREQGTRRPYPNQAELIIEVADGSLELDREIADDYAAAGVPDYWIVNVRDVQIEVYRRPVADTASFTGHRYAERRVYGRDESVSPLAKPDVSVVVKTLADVA